MDLNRNDSPNNNNNNNDGRKPGGNRPKGSIGTALLITLAIVLLVNWIYGSISKSQYTQTSFSDFLAAKDAGQLSEVEIQSDRIIYMTKEEAGKPAAMQKACYTGLPGGGDLIALSEELDAMGVKVEKKIVEDNSLIMMILSYALMIGGLFLVMNLLTKRMGGDGMMGGFGKSKAKVYMEKQTGVTFKDVAGQDEAKESLQEIIDFLHNPQKYTAIGAKLPKGAFFISDIIGASVVTEDGAEIGKLVDVLERPASNIYVVKGETEHLVPAVPEFIMSTDAENGVITVRLIEGM